MIGNLHKNRQNRGGFSGRQRKGNQSYNSLQDQMQKTYGDLIGYKT